mmetsp:Transcript_1733/g.5018  ORF Transcript_1733/g.5018 Transcript_1733/m.5018 type:complete len:231 (+) Transcript_1733:836-1528(+)
MLLCTILPPIRLAVGSALAAVCPPSLFQLSKEPLPRDNAESMLMSDVRGGGWIRCKACLLLELQLHLLRFFSALLVLLLPLALQLPLSVFLFLPAPLLQGLLLLLAPLPLLGLLPCAAGLLISVHHCSRLGGLSLHCSLLLPFRQCQLLSDLQVHVLLVPASVGDDVLSLEAHQYPFTANHNSIGVVILASPEDTQKLFVLLLVPVSRVSKLFPELLKRHNLRQQRPVPY